MKKLPSNFMNNDKNNGPGVGDETGRIDRYKAGKVLKFLAEMQLEELGALPLIAPRKADEDGLSRCEMAELRCRQLGWQSVEKVWEYFVLDLDGDFPSIGAESEPSSYPSGFRPEATLISELERIRIAYWLGPEDARDAIMAHLASFETEFNSC